MQISQPPPGAVQKQVPTDIHRPHSPGQAGAKEAAGPPLFTGSWEAKGWSSHLPAADGSSPAPPVLPAWGAATQPESLDDGDRDGGGKGQA